MVIRIAYENTAIKVWFLFDEWVAIMTASSRRMTGILLAI